MQSGWIKRWYFLATSQFSLSLCSPSPFLSPSYSSLHSSFFLAAVNLTLRQVNWVNEGRRHLNNDSIANEIFELDISRGRPK